MGIVHSDYLLLAKLKARFELERGKDDVGMIVRYRVAKKKRKLSKLEQLYNFIPDKHRLYYSPHTIKKDTGCGCKLCQAIHSYAKAKLHLHYLKKSFYTDNDFIELRPTMFPLQDNFYALYSEYQTNQKEGEETLTQLAFFNEIYKERKRVVKDLRSKYRAINEAIQHILAE